MAATSSGASSAIQPQKAYFGQKDAQQTVVIRQMVRDLALNLDVVVCPIVREHDGLALSSRNMRLTPDQRIAALVLARALTTARDEWRAGRRDADHLRGTMVHLIQAEPLARIDYVSVADPGTLQEIEDAAQRHNDEVFGLRRFTDQYTRIYDNILGGMLLSAKACN